MPPRPFPPSIQVTGMSTMQKSSMILLALTAVLVTQSGVVGQRAPAVQSPPSPGRDWMYHGGEPGGTRFSTLTQINADNVKSLTRAWTFHTGHTAGTFESTPLVIDSVLYFNASNGVFALDAVTGQADLEVRSRRAVDARPRVLARRRWLHAAGSSRQPARDSSPSIRRPASPSQNSASTESSPNAGRSSSPPSIYRNLVITQDNGPNVQAWDTITGEPAWKTELIAQPGDPNNATWLNDSWKTASGTDVWGLMTVDVERGTTVRPGVEGRQRLLGRNTPRQQSLLRLSDRRRRHDRQDEVVSADACITTSGTSTSRRRPTLVETRRDGKIIPGVAVITKMGLMFVFNRETGEPMWGMEERPVPQTKAPGEWTSPTQPFPIKPPPLARMSMTKADLPTVTPEHEAFCKGLWEKYRRRGLGAVRAVENRSRHRRVSRRARWRQLGRRDLQQTARVDDHQHSQHRPVGQVGTEYRAWRWRRRPRWSRWPGRWPRRGARRGSA